MAEGKAWTGLFPAHEPTGKWWYDHSLTIVLVTLMAAQTGHALWSGWYVFEREQPFGGKVGAGSGQFWVWWTYAYNISLVADTFGVILIVVLTKWLRERGSQEDASEPGRGPD